MIEALRGFLAFAAGAAVGAFFFGGLWWTVRQGVSSDYVAFWFLGSLVVRMTATLACFYFIAGNELGRLVPCLVGFVLARYLVVRMTRLPASSGPEVIHAP